MSVWNLLTEPAASIADGLERRQARILAAALVFLLPVWLINLTAALATRAVATRPHEWAIAITTTSLGLLAYGLSRTRHHRAAALILIVTSVIGGNVSAIVESERVRTVVSMLFGSIGALYAAVFMTTRATLVAALGSMACFLVFGSLHPALKGPDFVLPMFLLGFILALTVVAAAVREAQLETIKGQAANLQAVFTSANDAVVVLDAGGRIKEWSPRAEGLFGLSAADAQGRTLTDMVSLGERVRLDAELLAQRRFEFQAQGPEGTRAFEATAAPLEGGRGTVLALRDVSERKALEARLVMADRMETMGRMVAGVAHEINNPLAYVQANLRALEEDARTGTLPAHERAELFAETLEGTRRIQTIVKDLLTFARHSGEHEAVTPVQVESAIESALQIATVHVHGAGASIIRQFSNVGAVLAVESRLGQVVLTLVMNAVQALPPSGGRREILVSTRKTDQHVVVAVRDFGEGMTPETRARLFTPFFTTKPVGKGTGLGLSIAHSIVTSFGGEITVESAKGEGALFEVLLPLMPANATAASGG